jgi:hypothetical protein
MADKAKLIEQLNATIGARKSPWNALVADVIIELKRMSHSIDELERSNRMLHDATTLALKAMDGGFAEKVDYAQWDAIRGGLVKQLEIA